MNTSPRPVLAAGLVMMVSLAAAACGSTGNAAADGGGTVQIGVVLDRTGVLAATAVPAMNGIQLAVDEVNAKGGIHGRKVELLVEDGTSDPAVAAAAARNLSRKVPVVLGSAAGAGCRAMQPILDSAKVLQYCISPQQFNLTPLFFWGLAPTTDYPAATLPWLRSIKAHKLAFIGQDDASGDGYLSLFKYIAQANPTEFQIVAQERFGSGTTNLETQLTHLRDAKPDLVIAGTSGGNIVPVARAMNALGMDQPVWVGTGSATLDALKPLANDIPKGGLFANAFWVDVPDKVPGSVGYAPKVTAFTEAYSKQYGQPGALAGGAYDATRQILDGFDSGASTGPALAAYLEQNAHTGVLGPYEINAKRHQGATLPPVMMTYDGGPAFKLAYSGS
ncbi:ABC transporter substrate-binding protein [Dactylosporangium sp. CA-092794]|uniref:ABC transporter substrate-binding protein n=1 Tax=Dactylosporangium sp. CA-092794 TaxID=3239929 RepID=UPI003D901B5B